jgi:hypothetical protein
VAVACLLAGLAASRAVPAAGQAPAASRLTAQASGSVTRRGRIGDSAQLTVAAGATGTVSFSVYGPRDPRCAGPPATTSAVAVIGSATYTSATYVAPVAGSYRWIARYGGDANHAPAATACGDPRQTVVVTDPPPPVLGRSFQVGPLSGKIYVMAAAPATRAAPTPAKGVGFVPLVESRNLPIGSVIDARGGVARITTATGAAGAAGRVQVGDFGAGQFKVLQNRRERGLAELDLVVAQAAAGSCAAAAAAAAVGRARAAAPRRHSHRVLAQLRASAAGQFRTRGRFSAATVRGTAWDTVDRCDGTLTRVVRGVVLVRDFRRAVTIAVRAGKSYLAQAP